jgi:hypothetical protein
MSAIEIYRQLTVPTNDSTFESKPTGTSDSRQHVLRDLRIRMGQPPEVLTMLLIFDYPWQLGLALGAGGAH